MAKSKRFQMNNIDNTLKQVANNHQVAGKQVIRSTQGKLDFDSEIRNRSIEDITAQILDLKDRINEGLWLIGKYLLHIKEEKLYQKLECNTLNEYLENHVDISRSNAFHYMKIASMFTYDRTIKYGSKLRLLYNLSEIQIDEILGKIDDNDLTYKAVFEEVKKLKEDQAPSMMTYEKDFGTVFIPTSQKTRKKRITIECINEDQYTKLLEILTLKSLHM